MQAVVFDRPALKRKLLTRSIVSEARVEGRVTRIDEIPSEQIGKMSIPTSSYRPLQKAARGHAHLILSPQQLTNEKTGIKLSSLTQGCTKAYASAPEPTAA